MTRLLTRPTSLLPTMFEDFIDPWNGIFANSALLNINRTVPAVNITTVNGDFLFTMAVPGMKKEDFKIDFEDNLLIISCENEDTVEDVNAKYSRKEYNYSSFKRTFSIPVKVNTDKIEAQYVDGILKIKIPLKEELKIHNGHKHILIK